MFLSFLVVLMLVATLPVVLFSSGEMVGLTGLSVPGANITGRRAERAVSRCGGRLGSETRPLPGKNRANRSYLKSADPTTNILRMVPVSVRRNQSSAGREQIHDTTNASKTTDRVALAGEVVCDESRP